MRNTCPHQTLCFFLSFFILYLFFPFSASVHAVGRKDGKASVDSASKGKALVDEGEKLMKRGETAKSLLVINRYIDDGGMRGTAIADSALFAKALMLNAHNYVNIGNSRQALTLMRQALPIVRASGDRRRLSELYNNIFSIYYSRHEYDQAEDLLQAALQLSIADADSAAIRNLYNNFGLMYCERGKYASAIGFMDKALSYSPAADRLGRSLIFTNRAEVFVRQNRMAEAEKSLAVALTLQKGVPFDARAVQTSLNMAYVKARLGKRGEVAVLQHYIYKVMPRLPLPMQANSYEQLADIHFCLGDSLAALRDIMRYQPLSDSLRRANDDSQLQQLLVAYDADRLKQHNTNLQQAVDIYRLQADARSRLLWITIAFVLVLAALLVALWRRMKADRMKNALISRQQNQLLAYEQQEHERKQQEMQRKQEELRRKQEEMSLEIDHKNRQLTSYTLDLAAVNEFHQHVSSALAALREKKFTAAETDLQLKELIQSLQHFNDKPLGDDFRVYFDEVHPGFLMRLSQKHDLSPADLRLCAYLHLGMTTKEIAALTYKEVRSVESSRNRLRKKLNLPPETNLKQYLEQFAVVLPYPKNIDKQ